MFDINVYSVINSIIGACILMILCFLLEKLVIRGTITSTVYFLTFPLILLRLLLPVEIVDKTTLIQINKILPSVIRLFRAEIFPMSLPVAGLNISINTITLVASCLSLVSMIKCLKIISAYYNLYIRLKYISSTQDEKILRMLIYIKEKNNFKFNVKIIQNRLIDSPFEFGFFNQTICLPSANYSEEELYFILSHELYHFKNRSNWLKLFNNILAAVFWWNPLISFYHTSLLSMIEINCDELATAGFNDHLKARYLACLLSESHQQQRNRESQTIHFLSSDKSSLSKRFRFITEKHKKSKILCCLSAFIMVKIFFASYFFMVLPYFDVPVTEVKRPEFTKENSYILRKGDRYIIYFEDEPYIFLDSISESFWDLPIVIED